MKTHTANHKSFVFTLPIILIVLGVHGISYGQNLNVDEPPSVRPSVRLIYFRPNDRPFRQEVVDAIKNVIQHAQAFFTEQMQGYGYGQTTFRFETDESGEPLVHRVVGQHPSKHYGFSSNQNFPANEFPHLLNKIYFIVYDLSDVSVVGSSHKKNHGFAQYSVELILAANKSANVSLYSGKYSFYVVLHELGHAFGLKHDWRDGAYIMSYGPPGWNRLSACAAEFLTVHPYFNPDIPLEEREPPTIELISQQTYPAGAVSIPVRLKVNDSDGLHQVLLHAHAGLKACQKLNGEKDTIVEFDYDGFISPATDPNRMGTSLSNPTTHPMMVEAVDIYGNLRWMEFNLSEISPHRIATFEGHTDRVDSLAFGLSGKTIASGSLDGTVKLWDVATRHLIDSFKGRSLAFSPDGKIIAAPYGNGFRLSDIATKREIATFEGHTAQVNSVAISRDGKTVASGGSDGTVKLWNIATKREIATFKGHTGPVNSVAISRDGRTIASGGSDGTVKLWDISKRTNTETFEVGGWAIMYSVAFSPDSTILAAGVGNSRGGVLLWNVKTGNKVTSFGEGSYNAQIFDIYSIAFSPDGLVLASGSRDGTVKLWGIKTKTQITAFSHLVPVSSISFSPDGTALASGDWGGTVELWDITPFSSKQPIDDEDKITISEIMVASNGESLPQWIELYNPSDTHAVNLKGWRLEIQNRRSTNFKGRINATPTFKERTVEPQETLLIISKQGRNSNNFRNGQIYNLSNLHPNLQDVVLSREGFYLKLSNAAGETIDEVGNLDGKRNTDDKPAWSLPRSLTEEGARASIIRRHVDGDPQLGTEASGWISAINTKLVTNTTTYYGHPDDIGAPGIESGGALPVALSRFRAELTASGVVLKWITESELDNAGFNILRSKTKNGEFKVINSKLIQGAGTTSERRTYTWADTTAKPNVVYYYRIEDISHAGVREQLATVRMQGYVSAAGKLTIKWADLKLQE